MAYTDPLLGISLPNSAANDAEIDQTWYGAFQGLAGKNVISGLDTNRLRQLMTTLGDVNENNVSERQSAEAEVNKIFRDAGIQPFGFGNGQVTIGGNPFLVGFDPNLNNGQGGFRFQQANDTGVNGQKVIMTTDANGNVNDVNTWASNDKWKRDAILGVGTVLGGAAIGAGIGAGAGAAGGTSAASAAGATGAAAGEAAAAGSVGGLGSGAAGAGAAAGSVGGLGSGAGSTLGGALASGVAPGAASGVTSSLLPGAFASEGLLAGGAAASGAASWWDKGVELAKQYGGTAADWASNLYDFAKDNPGLVGALAGGVAGALGSGDETMTQTSTSTQTPVDPTGANAALQQLLSAQSAAPGEAATNPYAAENNPYLAATIDAANRGLVRNYNNVVAPKFASGSSFGNSGLAFAEENERANLMTQLSDNANQLSYQGYNLGAQLGESAAGRQDNMTQFNKNYGLNLASGLIGAGNALGTTQQNTQSTTAPGNIWASTLGGALLGSKIGQGWLNTSQKAAA